MKKNNQQIPTCPVCKKPKPECICGRPKEYTQEGLRTLCEKYLKVYRKKGEVVPSVEGLACYVGCCVKTLHNYAKDDKECQEFLQALDKLRDTQARELINKGLASKFNPLITKLLLHARGYSDKSEIKSEEKVLIVDDEEN